MPVLTLRITRIAFQTKVYTQMRECADELGLIDERPEGGVDATGLESRYASAHDVNRRNESGAFVQRHWPKPTVVCHVKTYLFAGAVMSRGPSNDVAFFKPAMTQAAEHIAFDRILADKGYDAEYAHQWCRDELGIRSTIIPLNPRRFKNQLPKTKYRRQMITHFHSRLYGHRWHVESAFSQTKRRLGSALRARNEQAQQREGYLRVLTHNLMVLRASPKRLSTEQAKRRISPTGSPFFEEILRPAQADTVGTASSGRRLGT